MSNQSQIVLAWELFNQGVPKLTIANNLGKHRETIHLWIKKGYREKSIGRFQVEKVIDWAKAKQIGRLHTKTWGGKYWFKKNF